MNAASRSARIGRNDGGMVMGNAVEHVRRAVYRGTRIPCRWSEVVRRGVAKMWAGKLGLHAVGAMHDSPVIAR